MAIAIKYKTLSDLKFTEEGKVSIFNYLSHRKAKTNGQILPKWVPMKTFSNMFKLLTYLGHMYVIFWAHNIWNDIPRSMYLPWLRFYFWPFSFSEHFHYPLKCQLTAKHEKYSTNISICFYFLLHPWFELQGVDANNNAQQVSIPILTKNIKFHMITCHRHTYI